MEEKNSEKKERKMRDSGVSWIGEVPEGWEFSKIKYHCTMKSGDNITALDISDNGEYPVYGGNGLRGFYKIYNKNGNHILIGRQGALAGNVHLVNGKFWATDHAVIVTLKNGVFINYFFRILESMNLNQYAFDTAAQPGLSVSRIMNLNIVLPNLKEQHRIADFLDSKCSEIDTLIENLCARVESAKEYKKAVITEAVTKGLDKDAKMKDSGVDWIGKIPEKWKVSRIGHDYNVTLGKMLDSKEYDQHEMNNYLCAANIKWSGVNTSINKKMKFSSSEKPLYLLQKDDVLIMEGGTAGTSCIYNNEFAPCYIQNSVHRCRAINNNISKYLYYWMHVVFYSGYINSICNKATILHYTKEKVEKTPIALPSIVEQKSIVNYLDAKCSEIDALLQNYEDQIATLEEYKKSLIYEYVTGKKEVPAA